MEDGELTPAVCPPCTRGEHDGCDGTTWCDLIDFPTVCECADTEHTKGNA